MALSARSTEPAMTVTPSRGCARQDVYPGGTGWGVCGRGRMGAGGVCGNMALGLKCRQDSCFFDDLAGVTKTSGTDRPGGSDAARRDGDWQVPVGL